MGNALSQSFTVAFFLKTITAATATRTMVEYRGRNMKGVFKRRRNGISGYLADSAPADQSGQRKQ